MEGDINGTLDPQVHEELVYPVDGAILPNSWRWDKSLKEGEDKKLPQDSQVLPNMAVALYYVFCFSFYFYLIVEFINQRVE